jgi:hypothetical protein
VSAAGYQHTGARRSGRPGPPHGHADDEDGTPAALIANLRASAERLRAMGDVWAAEGWDYAASVAYHEAAIDVERADELE